MLHDALGEHLDALIDELIVDGGVEAAALASILLTARDSIVRGDLVTLSRKVWGANNELLDAFARHPGRHAHHGPARSRPGTPAGG